MNHYRVLVLDDDEKWLIRHRYALRAEGIECVCTQNADRAIDIATTEQSITVAVIDEILMCENGEPQRLTGSDVVREILRKRAEMQFVMVSAKPIMIADERNDPRTVLSEESRLRRSGVYDVFHKFLLEKSPTEYPRLAVTLKTLHPGPLHAGRVLVGFGLNRSDFEFFSNAERGRSWWLDVSRWSEHEKKLWVVQRLFGLRPPPLPVRQTGVFYVGPGTRHPVGLSGLGPGGFRFLKVLAQKAAFGEDPEIAPAEYSQTPRNPLKTAKHRVEKRLRLENPLLRFKPWQGRSYKPEFEIGTILFDIESQALQPRGGVVKRPEPPVDR